MAAPAEVPAEPVAAEAQVAAPADASVAPAADTGVDQAQVDAGATAAVQ